MKFLQITDLHMNAGGPLYGLDPAERLAACIADIRRTHADADRAVITGDLAHSGDPAAYRRLREMLQGLEMPTHLLIGNHDSRSEFRKAFPDHPVDSDGNVQFTVDTAAGRFICLDTNVPGAHHGELDAARLRWLTDELDRAGEKPVYLFMHHPPFDVGIRRMDRISLRDKAAFAEVVSGRPGIRQLFFGHLHRPISGMWNGIPFANLPGMNHQVALDFEIEDEVPGSHEPPFYAVIFADPGQTIVHLKNFLDQTNTFHL
ncbi:phosphodiesterase [Frigidibacter sp. ROC022]|uniref:phosphodiesterase n=1 Tax=Frigidibacter sp. ROC022 TaxID=2971796 RepID=UPI00215B3AE4|nr:phosphodiesterase [Frigidibacter sp. ROC022]MCR8724681.1 phosphodiesterase [Frigidibacter sp. ROC022]